MKRAVWLTIVLSGCATTPEAEPADKFFARLRALCGQAFAGSVVSTDPADKDMIGKPLVLHVRECSSGAVRIPFHVGTDRSRTWVISRTAPDFGLSTTIVTRMEARMC